MNNEVELALRYAGENNRSFITRETRENLQKCCGDSESVRDAAIRILAAEVHRCHEAEKGKP